MVVFTSPLPPVVVPELDLFSYVFRVGEGARNAPATPADKTVLVDGVGGTDRLTWKELRRDIEALASGLHARGFGPGDVLGIYSPNHVEYAIALFAAIRLGGAATTANPTYTADELKYQLGDAKAIYLITIPDLVPVAEKAIAGTLVKEIFVFGPIGSSRARPLRTLYRFAAPPPIPAINVRTTTAVLCYSSGTTGRPKGVELTHYNLVSNIVQVATFEKDLLVPSGVLHAVLPLYHCYALVVVLLVGLRLGMTIVIQAKFELVQFLTIVQKYRVTVSHIVPPIVIALAKSPVVDQYDLSSIKMVMSGAAPLGREIQEEASRRLKVVVKQGYGMSELSPVSHVNPTDVVIAGSVGYLVANQTAKIVDPVTGRELGYDEEGELWIKGPNVMKGYLNNEKATRETIDADGYLHTGDVAKVDRREFFYITDRLKELIKYKGLQVAPAELEALLLTHPAVQDVAVIPIPNDDAGEVAGSGGQVPRAFVVLKPNIADTPEIRKDIIAFLDGRVAPHKKLRGGLEVIKEVPKSASGKILRRMLRPQAPAPAARL